MPRGLQPKERFINSVAAFLCVGEHLLEHPKGEFRLPRRATRERSDVILDVGWADRVERTRTEDAEMRQHLADTRQRRRADA
jgi:hypothetical protein